MGLVIMIHRHILERSIHPLALPIGPGMLRLGQSMLNSVLSTDTTKDVVESIAILQPIGELNTVVGQDSVNAIRHNSEQIAQELRRFHLASTLVELSIREL